MTQVGRKGRTAGIYIGRGSQFGNPFRIGQDGSRDEVIRKYSSWFYARLAQDPEFGAAVRGLRGSTLLCFCAPLPCHGDVIRDALERDWGAES